MTKCLGNKHCILAFGISDKKGFATVNKSYISSSCLPVYVAVEFVLTVTQGAIQYILYIYICVCKERVEVCGSNFQFFDHEQTRGKLGKSLNRLICHRL